MKNTKLIDTREPTRSEKEKQVEIVFIRQDKQGNEIEIFGATCYESWEQWGAPSAILSDNCEDIETWRQEKALY